MLQVEKERKVGLLVQVLTDLGAQKPGFTEQVPRVYVWDALTCLVRAAVIFEVREVYC